MQHLRIWIIACGICSAVIACRQERRGGNSSPAEAPPTPSVAIPQAPVPSEPVAPSPPPKPVVPPRAQSENERIAYNGLETFMRGKIRPGDRKTFLLRVRKDQQVNISIDPADAGISLAVLDQQGASIGNPGTVWQWTSTYAGDLQVLIHHSGKGDAPREFTIRVAPY